MLFKNFDNYSKKTALILTDDTQVSYEDLQIKVNKIARKLGIDRKLVFIEVNNNLTSIITYLACVQNNHPVLLLNADSVEQNQAIITLYQPNIVINAKGNEPQFVTHNPHQLDLHSDLCLLLATSGSTGSPKLVKLSHKNIFSNTQSIASYLDLSDSDRAITSLKFNYSYGLSIINSHLHVGASIFLTNNSINDPCFWQQFNKHNITSFSGVPYNFEVLAKQNFKFDKFSSLRYITQAGGKLSTTLIQHFAEMGKRYRYNFYVMYGQTEASPRISYLPPENCISHSDYIGVPVPGGTISLLDESGNTITEPNIAGELAYKGPNVMIGYAKSVEELAIAEKITWLHTGDIAIQNQLGLFKITGRKSRFAKPFGIRVNLDDIQSELSELSIINAVSSENELIIIAIESSAKKSWPESKILNLLESKFNINRIAFSLQFIENMPLLSNGKLDYRSIAKLGTSAEGSSKSKAFLFIQFFKEELLLLSGIKSNCWNSIKEIYSHFFNGQNIIDTSTFISHAGDSLLYVSISIELEQYLGHLPHNWHLCTLEALEKMKYSNEF